MKNKIFSFYILLVMPLLVLMTSCKKEIVGPTVTISSTSATSAYGGDEVTLQGENLHTVENVFVGQKHATDIVSQSESALTFVVPTTAVPGPSIITLAMVDGYRVTTDFEVLLRPIPIIEAISPSGAAPGEQVTIRGVNLDNLISTSIGGVSANIVSATNTELVLTVPNGATLNTPAEIELATQEATAVSTSIFYVGSNYIANSDLEAGSGDDYEDWEKLNGGDQMTEITGDAAYFGRSIRIVGAASNPWNTQLACKPTPLNFGSEYTVIMWARAEAEGAIMRISASQYDGNGADYFYGDDTAIPTEWTQLSWTFEVTNDLPTHKIVLDMGTTDVPFVLDNITLIETGAAGPPVPQSVLPDGGFENGIYPSGAPDGVASWEVLNGTFAITTDEVHCGNQALQVTGAGTPDQHWNTQLATDHIELTAGVEYVASIWAKTTGPEVPISISVSQYDGNGSDYFYGAVQNINSEWAAYSWTFTAQDPPSGLQRLVLDLGRSAEVFFLDDISVKEKLPPVNILPDGGFENGIYPANTPDGVASWEVLNGTFEITTVADEIAEGSQGLKVTGAGTPDQPWNTQMAADHIDLITGNTYAVTVMAKSTGPEVPISISVSRWNNSDGSDYFYGDPQNINGEWAEYTWTFVAQDPPSGLQRVVLDLGRSAEVFFIDDIIVYEVPEFVCP
ncbi:MAG: carbohydrate binding domain-containing protein [Lewinella sp.]|uniref:carbohydrate binding domain-containing protein n=1 Tax=Lewinella sp. TaxID=2004506 RepID=UPI003D6B9422